MPHSVRRKATILNEQGMHLRPLSLFVGISEKYPACELKVSYDGQSANGKSIVSMMMLQACKGAELELHATGEGAEELVTKLETLIRNKFNEESHA